MKTGIDEYKKETAVAYQANAGQTKAGEYSDIPIVAFKPAPDPDEPLPIQLSMKQEFLDRGFAVGMIGRQEFLPGVTSEMLDWFWANMEKCYYLWAPGEHKSFRWLRSPGEVGFLQSAHEIVEPAGPVMMRVQITRLDPAVWYPFTECLEHLICEGIFNAKGELNDATIHQWQDVPGGCIHITATMRNEKISELPACIQAIENDMRAFFAEHRDYTPPAHKHAEYESARWPVFLPAMYTLWKDHPDPSQNVACDLEVKKEAGLFRYVSM